METQVIQPMYELAIELDMVAMDLEAFQNEIREYRKGYEMTKRHLLGANEKLDELQASFAGLDEPPEELMNYHESVDMALTSIREYLDALENSLTVKSSLKPIAEEISSKAQEVLLNIEDMAAKRKTALEMIEYRKG
jgi:chromosome segregation ATPase